MKKKLFIFVIIIAIIILGTIVFFSINKIENINKNDWNIKITEGFIGSRVFYFYDDNKLIVEDSFHGINEYEWKEDIDLNKIYKYVENYNSEKNNDEQHFLVVQKNGTEKYIDQNNNYMEDFFECFWNYILK